MRLVTPNADLEAILTNSKSPIPIEHKIKVYELLDHLRLKKVEEDRRKLINRILCSDDPYHNPEIKEGVTKGIGIGMIIIIGYEKDIKDYLKPIITERDFKKKPISIYDESAESRLYDLCRSNQHDGAVFIAVNPSDPYSKEDTKIIDNSLNIEVNPGQILTENGIPNNCALQERLKIKTPIGTGYTHAKSFSLAISDALVYKISRCSGEIRAFEAGETILAHDRKEITVKPKINLIFENFDRYRVINKAAV